MCRVKGKINGGSQDWSTAIGRAVLTDDDGAHVVTKLGPHGCIDWQVTARGWSAQQVRDVLLSRALDEIGGAG